MFLGVSLPEQQLIIEVSFYKIFLNFKRNVLIITLELLIIN